MSKIYFTQVGRDDRGVIYSATDEDVRDLGRIGRLNTTMPGQPRFYATPQCHLSPLTAANAVRAFTTRAEAGIWLLGIADARDAMAYARQS